MESAVEIFRLLTVSQVILLMAGLLLYQRHSTGILASILLLAFSCYLAMPLTRDEFLPAVLMATILPSILWLFVWWVFNDRRNIPWWLIIVTAGYAWLAVTPAADRWLLFRELELDIFVYSLVPQIVKLGLVFHSLVVALQGRKNDLVDARLRLRGPLAIGGGLLAALIIVVEIGLGEPVPVPIVLGGSVLMFAIVMAASLRVWRLELDLGFDGGGKSDQPLKSSARIESANGTPDSEASAEMISRPDPLIERIVGAMQQDRFYARPGVTLEHLGEHLRVPVYQLRRAINRSMGYRNFNQFINHYRIEEASHRLKNEQSLPILSIALDVGFKSLSSFNQAFRATHGCTPTDFRKVSHV